jgi:hypothetical protein
VNSLLFTINYTRNLARVAEFFDSDELLLIRESTPQQVACNDDASSEGRCILRFQVYCMSAQTDCLLVWR